MAAFALYVIFIVVFFANSFRDYGIIPPHLTLITEFLIYFLFLLSQIQHYKRENRFHYHLIYYFVFFIIVAVCSLIVNDYYNLRPIMSLRLILRFYVFYLALINLGLDDERLLKINKLLFLLFIIQIPTAFIKFSIYGINEKTIGTYSSHSGGMTTIIPIIAVSYLAGYYFFYKKNNIYVLLTLGYLLWGIAGAKKVLIFLWPMVFIGLYFLVLAKQKKFVFAKKFIILGFILIISSSIVWITIKINPQLNPENKVGGKVDVRYTFNYITNYTTKMKGDNPEYAGGRFATLITAIDEIRLNGLEHAFLGFGPGSMTMSVLDKKPHIDKRIYRISNSYGITGMVYILIEYGLLGLISISIIFCIFIYNCWKWYNIEEDKYWQGFSLGSLVFSILIFFVFIVYNRITIIGDTIPPVFYYAMAAMYYRTNKLRAI